MQKKNKRDISPDGPQNLAEQSSGNNLLNSRILKRVNCINWEFKLSVKSTMSSVDIYLHFIEMISFIINL